MPSITPPGAIERTQYLGGRSDDFDRQLLAQADAASPAEGLAHAARAAAAWVLSGKAFADGAKAASDLKDAVVANYPTARDWTVAQWKAFNSFYADAVMRSGGSGLALNTSVDTARVTPQDARTLRALVDGAIGKVATGKTLTKEDYAAAAMRRVSDGENAVPESYGLDLAKLAKRSDVDVVLAYMNGADAAVKGIVESLAAGLNAAGVRATASALLSPRLAEAARDKLLVIVNHGYEIGTHGFALLTPGGEEQTIRDRKTGERRLVSYSAENIADFLDLNQVSPREVLVISCSAPDQHNQTGRTLANRLGVPVTSFEGAISDHPPTYIIADEGVVNVERWTPGRDDPDIQLRLKAPP